MNKTLIGILLLVGTTLVQRPVAADEVTSYAIITENGLLRIRGEFYRLDGLYIPQVSNLCDSSFTHVSCEVRNAVQALNSRINGFVHCVDHGVNADGTLSAYCSFGDDDLGAFLVRNGYAMAAPNAPYQYFALENLARHQGRGLWMSFITPGVQQIY
jgi:endonuclease YncB( thermonuclease family)